MYLSASAHISQAEQIAKAGFQAMDLDLCKVILQGEKHDSLLDGENPALQVAQLKERCDRLGLALNTCHLPFHYKFVDYNDAEFIRCHEITCRALAAAEQLGIRWAVMHLNKVDTDPELVISRTVDYAKKLFRDSGVTKTGIAIENTSKKSMEEAIEIHDQLKAEGYDVCFCLDVGHCHINQFHGITYDVPTVIRQLGDRLKMLHLHDNARNTDAHTSLFMGNIPWVELAKALGEIGYDGDFNLELNLNRVPAPLFDAYLKFNVEAARYLMKIVEENR